PGSGSSATHSWSAAAPPAPDEDAAARDVALPLRGAHPATRGPGRGAGRVLRAGNLTRLRDRTGARRRRGGPAGRPLAALLRLPRRQHLPHAARRDPWAPTPRPLGGGAVGLCAPARSPGDCRHVSPAGAAVAH